MSWSFMLDAMMLSVSEWLHSTYAIQNTFYTLRRVHFFCADCMYGYRACRIYPIWYIRTNNLRQVPSFHTSYRLLSVIILMSSLYKSQLLHNLLIALLNLSLFGHFAWYNHIGWHIGLIPLFVMENYCFFIKTYYCRMSIFVRNLGYLWYVL